MKLIVLFLASTSDVSTTVHDDVIDPKIETRTKWTQSTPYLGVKSPRAFSRPRLELNNLSSSRLELSNISSQYSMQAHTPLILMTFLEN